MPADLLGQLLGNGREDLVVFGLLREGAGPARPGQLPFEPLFRFPRLAELVLEPADHRALLVVLGSQREPLTLDLVQALLQLRLAARGGPRPHQFRPGLLELLLDAGHGEGPLPDQRRQVRDGSIPLLQRPLQLRDPVGQLGAGRGPGPGGLEDVLADLDRALVEPGQPVGRVRIVFGRRDQSGTVHGVLRDEDM